MGTQTHFSPQYRKHHSDQSFTNAVSQKVADGKLLTAPEGFKKYWGERKISNKHLGRIQD